MFDIKHMFKAKPSKANASNSKHKKKKKDGLSAIFQESVIETSIEEFRNNGPFIVEKDGETVFVAMLLETADIGGLGKKSKRDEAKGQFIEEVRSGRIKTYMPEEFILDDKMVFEPDPSTLVAMDEFMMLIDAPYTICYVHEDGSVDTTNSKVSYELMKNVADGSMDLQKMLAGVGETWIVPEEEPTEQESVQQEPAAQPANVVSTDFEQENEVPDVPAQAPALDLDDASSTAAPAATTVPAEAYNNAPTMEPANAEANMPVSQPVSEPTIEDDEPVDAPAAEDDNTVTEAQMQQAITRRFYSDDLGLQISTEAFDAQFLHANPYIPFDENRGDGWLDQYLDQMSKSANLEMRRLHQKNLFEMRAMFYDLISKHSETIQHELDADDSTTLYGQMLSAVKTERSKAYNEVADRVSKRRDEINADWDQKLAKAGEDGKISAEKAFRDRFGRQHEEDLNRVESDIRNQIDADYDNSVREMHDKRRNDASKRMDYGVTETLAEVSKLYQERINQETKVYQDWRKKIDDFIDKHRKEDVAHDRTLAEELAQKTKADKVLAEYTAKLKEQTEDFEAKKQSMKAEIEAINRKTATEVLDKQAECDSRIAEMQKNLDEQKKQMAELLDKYAALDAEKEKQYDARLAEARDEKDAWSDKCEHIIAMHRKGSIVFITLAIVACVAMLAIGTLIGSNMSLDVSSRNASKQVVREFNSRMNKVEKNSKSNDDAR